VVAVVSEVIVRGEFKTVADVWIVVMVGVALWYEIVVVVCFAVWVWVVGVIYVVVWGKAVNQFQAWRKHDYSNLVLSRPLCGGVFVCRQNVPYRRW